MKTLHIFFRETMNVSTNGLFFAPILRFIAPNLFRWNQYVKCINRMIDFFQTTVKKHKETFDPTELR